MDEHKLLKECLAGKVQAQKLLYDTFAPKMFGVCLRYASDRSMAEDFLQEGFIRVYAGLKTFKSKGSLEGWIRRIMINTSLDILRKKDILRHSIQIDGTHDLSYDSTDSELSIELYSAEMLTHALNQMPPGFRMVFNLYAVEELTHKEIAKMLHISEGTSKSQYARARKWLQNKLMERKQITKHE